ncbi:adenosine monophosphate-protein transferase FICD [Corchorus olitorius]|uniref:Adenosine monophosphate-protein transferase FICD n=1 Tax=Corchorus olitorius TaxID=93759 RepID=A0A1R3L1N7_9ROSI|nr:adenosine monophosphate-protein transferase FICD [Corchorus olitorius]
MLGAVAQGSLAIASAQLEAAAVAAGGGGQFALAVEQALLELADIDLAIAAVPLALAIQLAVAEMPGVPTAVGIVDTTLTLQQAVHHISPGAWRGPGGSEEGEGERFGNVGGFFFAFDFQGGGCLEQPLAGFLLGDVREGHRQAHSRIDLDRLDEAHAVESVVHHHLQPFGQDEDVFHQLGDQRQAEEAMGNGAAKWRFCCLHRVHVDELEVAGGLGEQVDAFLIDLQPFGTSQFLTNVLRQLCNGYIGHRDSPDCP